MTIKQTWDDKFLDRLLLGSMALFVIASTMLAGKQNRQIQELQTKVERLESLQKCLIVDTTQLLAEDTKRMNAASQSLRAQKGYNYP
jgi:hypothetical protein